MSRSVFSLADQAATEQLARHIADQLRPGDVLLLEGDLGAGKSTFARALLRHLAQDADLEVPSPSYTLVQSYATPRGEAHHFDLWRLADSGELTELGWDDMQNDMILVEWPERLGNHRPIHALTLHFTILDDNARSVQLSGWADRLECLP